MNVGIPHSPCISHFPHFTPPMFSTPALLMRRWSSWPLPTPLLIHTPHFPIFTPPMFSTPALLMRMWRSRPLPTPLLIHTPHFSAFTPPMFSTPALLTRMWSSRPDCSHLAPNSRTDLREARSSFHTCGWIEEEGA